jgi:hypothetical protein
MAMSENGIAFFLFSPTSYARTRTHVGVVVVFFFFFFFFFYKGVWGKLFFVFFVFFFEKAFALNKKANAFLIKSICFSKQKLLLFVKAKLQCRVYKIGIIKKQMLYKTKANAFQQKSYCFPK